MTIRGYIRPRGRSLEVVVVLDGGRKLRRSTGCVVGQEDAARRVLDEALAEIRASNVAAVRRGELTFREWGERWIAERKLLEKNAAQDEESRLRHHAYPELGDVPVMALKKDTLLRWARSLRERRRDDGRPISPRYEHHIADTVRQLLADAVERDIIPANPCAWKKKRDLRPIADVNLRKRSEGAFEAGEVWELTHDPRIPEPRRVLYALEFLTGMRPGEAAIRRWRDLDNAVGPLWRLHVGTAWNTHRHREKTTKTIVERVAPVHPVLRDLLESWAGGGWARYVGRAPASDDLIVPADRGGPRGNSHSNAKFQADVELLGLRGGRTHYETKATFRSLALAGGAQPQYLDLITHPNPREAKDLYTRLNLMWPALCAAVECIRIAPPTEGVTGEVTARAAETKKARPLVEIGPFGLARGTGFEPVAFGSGGRRSIHLS